MLFLNMRFQIEYYTRVFFNVSANVLFKILFGFDYCVNSVIILLYDPFLAKLLAFIRKKMFLNLLAKKTQNLIFIRIYLNKFDLILSLKCSLNQLFFNFNFLLNF